MKRKEKNIGIRILVLPLVLLLIAGGWYLWARYEGEKPTVQFGAFPEYIGMAGELSARVSDNRSGIRRVWIGLLKDGKEILLFEKNYPAKGLFQGGSLKFADVNIAIDPKKLGVTDGTAKLRMTVRDFSWRRWWHGNHQYIERDVVIDTQSPGLAVVSRAHNVSQGGSALVIYKLSEPCAEHGVVVGDNFFPGHSGYFKDPQVCLAFFALSHTQGRGTPMKVQAVDAAGNTATSGFAHYIRKKQFKRDKINISDRFLNWKMPEFTVNAGEADGSMLAKFLAVNRQMRQENYEQVQMIGRNTDTTIHWGGAFRRLPEAATRATFADLRDYYYKGKVIDQQRHLGIDLASYAHADIPAANAGRIATVGDIGIYGKTVVIDHGFGLFSMYAHLSHIIGEAGAMVAKDQIVGNTGTTGLAGGDHLHFGMMVHNTLVDPIEWWDKNWIKNNITAKLDMAAEQFPTAQ